MTGNDSKTKKFKIDISVFIGFLILATVVLLKMGQCAIDIQLPDTYKVSPKISKLFSKNPSNICAVI